MSIRFTYLQPRPLQIGTGLTLALVLASLSVLSDDADECGMHEFTDESTSEGPCIVVNEEQADEQRRDSLEERR